MRATAWRVRAHDRFEEPACRAGGYPRRPLVAGNHRRPDCSARIKWNALAVARENLRRLGCGLGWVIARRKGHDRFSAGDLQPVGSMPNGFGRSSTASRATVGSIRTCRKRDGAWGSRPFGTDVTGGMERSQFGSPKRPGDLAACSECGWGSCTTQWRRGKCLVQSARTNIETLRTTDRSSRSDTGTRSSRSHEHRASRRPRMVDAGAFSLQYASGVVMPVLIGKISTSSGILRAQGWALNPRLC